MSVDPVELELMRSLFEAAAEEMGITLQRTAYSANIKERRDFSCALFDARGELLAQAAHIPVHLGSMPASVEAVLRRLDKLAPGDAAIVNDPFAGGTHLPDITLVSPIHVDGAGASEGPRLIGYAANRAHHADVGGVSPGSMTLSTHIDEEGLRIEPARLYRRGVRDEAVLSRILQAVRTPVERLGDLEAQIAANHIGQRAMRKMVAGHGVEKVLCYGAALLDYAQAFMREVVRTLPDGVWRFEDVMDDDGTGSGPVRIAVELHVLGDRVVVDLSGSADQVAGCINCPEAVTRSAVYYCFACLLQEQTPLNGGCFRNVEVRTRAGSVLHAQHPAAVVAGNVETSQRVVDVVLGALSQALPDRIPAASCGTMSSVALGAADWTYYETIGGGAGAGNGFAGEPAVQCHMTNTMNTPAEAIELQYPLRVRRFERAAASGGAGRFRGGEGIVREIEALVRCEGTILSDRRRRRPYGLRGGKSGSPGRNELYSRETGQWKALPGMARFTMKRGDVLKVTTPGGGGFGEEAAGQAIDPPRRVAPRDS